jgi:hypothetical protein
MTPTATTTAEFYRIHFDEAAVQRAFIWMQRNSSGITTRKCGDLMERRNLLKLTFGLAAGATMLAASAMAAPLPPMSAPQALVAPHSVTVEPAVVSQNDVDRLKPEQVRWGHHWHRHHWHRRHWGWHHRHWRHRW